MATYECEKCGMAVNITCAKCDSELVDGEVVLEDGTKIPTAECPKGCGKIIKPKCCGEDMSCEIGD